MKRLLPAVIFALVFHVIIFSFEPEWLGRKENRIIKRPAVSVTMSYRKKTIVPPVKEIPEKKKTVKKIEKKKTVKPVKKKDEKKVEQPDPEPKQEPVKEEAFEQEVGTPVPLIEDTGFEVPEAISEPENERSNDVVIEAVPLYRENPEPPYPRLAQKRGYEGTVILSVLVDEDGLVDNLWVFETSGYNILDNAALKAVKDWIFEPAKMGNKKIEMWVEVPVKFELK